MVAAKRNPMPQTSSMSNYENRLPEFPHWPSPEMHSPASLYSMALVWVRPRLGTPLIRRRSSSNVVCLGPTSCPEALFTVVAVGAPREAAGTGRVDLHRSRVYKTRSSGKLSAPLRTPIPALARTRKSSSVLPRIVGTGRLRSTLVRRTS
jgi:hypothetical protein